MERNHVLKCSAKRVQVVWFFLLEHLSRCHPFVAKLYFKTDCDEEVESFAQTNIGANHLTNRQLDLTSTTDNNGQSNTQNHIEVNFSEASILNCADDHNGIRGSQDGTFDQKRAFVIDDHFESGSGVFHAVKKRRGCQTIQAVAVREHGTEKYAKRLCFLFAMTEPIVKLNNTWIAVPRPNVYSTYLFSNKLKMAVNQVDDQLNTEDQELRASTAHDDVLGPYDDTLDEIISPEHGTTSMEQSSVSDNTHGSTCEVGAKEKMKGFLSSRCDVLSVGQRCADWFIMRQFRVAGTNAGKVLLSSNIYRRTAGVKGNGPERTLKDWDSIFVSSWFSTMRSTEAMKRGSVNEDAVLSALQHKPYVHNVFSFGMCSMRNQDYLACSSDGVALIDQQFLSGHNFDLTQGMVAILGKLYYIETVGIKSVFAQNTVNNALQSSEVDLLVCRFGDDTFKKFIPTENSGQVIQQMIVLNVHFCLYVRAT